MKLGTPLAAAAAIALLATGASAQSSKFAATYDTDPVMRSAIIDGTSGEATDGPHMIGEFDLASLHVAQWKEVLVGVSAQVQLMTFTQAKGKNKTDGTTGNTATAIATGTVGLKVVVVPEGTANACTAATADQVAHPGAITLASRAQTLSVTVSLDVVGSIPDVCNAQCIADNLGIAGDVTVALGLDTTAAHHFNFIADDLTSGWYDIVACYDVTALAEVAGIDIDAGTIAETKVVLGPRIITVQEVRATKTGVVDETGSN